MRKLLIILFVTICVTRCVSAGDAPQPSNQPIVAEREQLRDLTTPQLIFCLGMAAMVGTVVALVYIVTVKKASPSSIGGLARDLLPLITVGVIVAGAFKLAVLGAIPGSAVAALYSAIAGYVLGKAGRPAEHHPAEAGDEKAPRKTPDDK